MMLLLAGITCSYLAFFCASSRYLVLLFPMFSALLIKVQRVAFYGVQGELHPSVCVSNLAGLAIQMSLVIISLAFNHPTVERTRRLDDDNDLALPDIVITCKEEHIAIIIISIVYETALIGVATALGVFSFKYPENFNEEKYISFCTFALLIVWIGLIPTYFTTKFRQEYQNAAISFFVLLSAYAMHIFIFGPKLYIVIFQPQRNTTHYSTHHTASAVDGKETGDLQMHGGSYKDGM